MPRTIPARDADISADAMVIGVTVGDNHRAYLIEAFEMRPGYSIYDVTPDGIAELGRHVVNDLVDDVPISVTYCDDNKCGRVFVGDGGGPLDLAVGGMQNGQLCLQLYRDRFTQDSDSPPIDDYPFETTSWELWKSKHPDTDIYVGNIP